MKIRRGKKIKFGYMGLDKITGGILPGELVLIGARPQMGSTAFVHNVMSKVIDKGDSVYFALYEHACLDYLDSLLSLYTMLAREGNSRRSEGEIVIEEFEGPINLEKIRDNCKTSKDNKVSVIVIDAIRLADYSLENVKGIYRDFGELFKKLKGLAMDLQVPIIVAARWSRDCESEGPFIRNDIATEGAFVVPNISRDDFDTVIFLYRDDYYLFDDNYVDKPLAATNQIDVIVAKSKRKAGVCKYWFDEKTGEIRGK